MKDSINVNVVNITGDDDRINELTTSYVITKAV